MSGDKPKNKINWNGGKSGPDPLAPSPNYLQQALLEYWQMGAYVAVKVR